MGNPAVPDDGDELQKYKIDMSHQEMERLVRNLHEIWDCFSIDGDGAPTGVEWLPVEGIATALCDDLGYVSSASRARQLRWARAVFAEN